MYRNANATATVKKFEKTERDFAPRSHPVGDSREIPHHLLHASGVSTRGRSRISSEISELIEIRNLSILKFINEMKYAVDPQIEDRFFSFAKEKSKKYFESAKTKLLALEQITIKEREDGKLPLIMLTSKGHEALVQKSGGKLVPDLTKSMISAGIRHDLILNDLRHALEEENLITKWYSEKMLLKEGALRKHVSDLPDALVIDSKGSGHFMELEVAMKSKGQYEAKIQGIQKALEVDAVKREKIIGGWFVCTDEKVFAMIEGLAKRDPRIRVDIISSFVDEN